MSILPPPNEVKGKETLENAKGALCKLGFKESQIEKTGFPKDLHGKRYYRNPQTVQMRQKRSKKQAKEGKYAAVAVGRRESDPKIIKNLFWDLGVLTCLKILKALRYG